LLNLLDGPDSMIRVNDFLADFEAHHYTSIDFEKSDCAARAGPGEKTYRRRVASGPLVCESSLASGLTDGQGSAVGHSARS